jgi:16S rRNA (adenine1518-N6/adenine1519-N6)-dimethyltransferase
LLLTWRKELPVPESEELALDGLPPLREVIERHGLSARKSLGQNFLCDLNLTRRIARAAGPLDIFAIVEVGSGPGGLTRALLAEGATNLMAVEMDERAVPALEEIASRYPGCLTIIRKDALQLDWQRILQQPSKIVANLPYNIGTALLVQWLSMEPWPPPYISLTLMFQKEVAQRIVAKPGEDAYGRLAVLCQWRCTAVKLFDVNRAAFTPPPKVTSSIVQLIPRPQPLVDCRLTLLEKVTGAAFGQRRKMLRSSLKRLFANPELVLEPLGYEGTERAEELPVEAFGQLALQLEKSHAQN